MLFTPPGDLPDPGTEPRPTASQDSLPSEPPEVPQTPLQMQQGQAKPADQLYFKSPVTHAGLEDTNRTPIL